MKIKELIAGQEVITIALDEPLARAAELMREKDVSGLPVVDEWGVLAGLITATDVLRLATPHSAPWADLPLDAGWSPSQRAATPAPDWATMTVRNVMVTDLCTVDESSTVQGAARAMIDRGVHRAIVLGRDRNVRGVVSALDMTALVADAAAVSGAMGE